MAPQLATALPRLVALMLVAVASTAVAAYAVQREEVTRLLQPAAQPAGPAVLVVPDVRGQAYVFAKGVLEESGFAWKLDGAVRGYSANLVVAQSPEPGTRVIDTGRPTLRLRLERSGKQSEHGTPENRAPYAGTEIRTLAPVAPPA
jgi:beta-lactam-binding protein with PASTA domain